MANNQQVMELLIRAKADFSNTQTEVQNLQKYLNSLNLPTKLKSSFTELFAGFETEAKKYQKFLDSGFKTKGDITGLEKSGNQISKILNTIHKEMSGISPDLFAQIFKGIDLVGLEQAEQKVKTLKQELQNMYQSVGSNGKTFANNFAEAEAALKKIGKSAAADQVRKAFSGGNLAEMTQAVNALKTQADNYETTKGKAVSYASSVETLINFIGQLNTMPGLMQKQEELNQAQTTFQQLSETNMNQLISGFANATAGAGDLSARLKQNNQELNNAATSMFNFNNEVEHLKGRISYFFGLTNGVMMFRRALKSAFNAVKELDSVMTQTAVVTDFTVGDMWDQLPRYTKMANEFGVTVKGAYEAATLYYQQGLSTNEVMAVSAETLKMAKIAGLDYADATNFMTAALRGFNMEVNEINSQKVNDVYSKLAAITASDTKEIATAMTKTASIADNANMEFETTAAFLSQIIETTRESAETAGTAMKTVIARFQELKKDPAEIGGVDGELIDANKIEGALRTIGVALRDEVGQFRDLDDVFLEIAEKWDGLDTNTQRYIATIAAGSRQQSRFIAMMSNYERTMELVDAANGAAGASQEQFEKTLDSLQSKLDTLSNSWNEYLMGIANSEVIKGFIDLLTGLIDMINKFSNGFGDFGSVVAKIGIALLAFKGARFALSLFDPKMIAKEGEKAGALASTKFYKGFQQKKANYNAGRAGGHNWITSAFGKAQGDPITTYSPSMSVSELRDNYAEQIGTQANALGRVSEAALLSGKMAMQETYDGIAKVKAEAEATGIKIKEIGTITTTVSQKMTTDWGAVGGALMGVGALMNMIINSIDDMDEKSKEAWSGIANGVTVAGMAMMILPKIVEALAGSISAAATTALGVVGLVLGAAIAIGKLIDVFWENAEEKEKRLATETKAMATAADEAKQAYDDLKESLENYNNAEDNLEKLTKGTDEWRDALIEANQQVLDLLKTYPQLAKYIKRGNVGQLILSPEGQEEALKLARESAQKTSVGSAATYAMSVTEELSGLGIFGDKGYTLLEVADMYGKEGAAIDTVEIEQIWETSGYQAEFGGSFLDFISTTKTTGSIEDAVQSNGLTKKSSQEILEELGFNQEKQIEFEGFLSNAIASGISEELAENEFSGDIQDIFSRSLNIADFELKKQNIENSDEKLKTNDITKLREYYTEVFGTEVPEDIANNIDSIRSAIANYKVFDGVIKNTEEFYSKFKKLNKDEQQKTIALLTQGGTKFTNKKITELLNNKDYKDAGNQLTTDNFESIVGMSPEEVAKALGFVDENGNGIAEKAVRYVQENITKAKELSDKVGENLSKVIGPNSGLLKTLNGVDVDYAAWNDITNNLSLVRATKGAGAATAAANVIDGFLSGIADSDMRAYAAEMLSIIDVSDANAIRGFSDAIKEQMYAMGMSEYEVSQFEEQLIDAAGAVREFNLDTLKEELESLADLEDDIKGRMDDGNRAFSLEEVQEWITRGANIDDFYRSGTNEWTYTGDMVTLLQLIENHSADILGEMRGSLEDRIRQGEMVANAGYTMVRKTGDRGSSLHQVSAIDMLEGVVNGTIAVRIGEDVENAYGKEGPGSEGYISAHYLSELFPDINWEDMTPAAAIEKAKELLGDYNSLEANKAQQADTEKLFDPYYNTDPYELAETASQKAKNKVLKNTTIIDSSETTEKEEAQNSLDKRLKTTAGAQSEYNRLLEEEQQKIGKGKQVSKERCNQLKAQAIASQETKIKIQSLNSTIEDNKDILKDFDAESATQEEWAALDSIASKAQEVFGPGVTKEFIAENKELFNQLAQGGKTAEEAYEKIAKKATEAYIQNSIALGDIKGDAKEIQGMIDSINNQDITVNGYGNFDNLIASLIAAGNTADEVATFINGLEGWEVEYVKPEDVALDVLLNNPNRVTKLGYMRVKKTEDTTDTSNAFGSYKPKDNDGGGGDDKFENDLDKQYNLLREIERLERRRAEYADEYADALERGTMSGLELAELTRQEMGYLQAQKLATLELISARSQEIKDLQKEYADISQYVWWDEQNGPTIAWDLINGVEDSELGDRITQAIEEYEQQHDELVKGNETLEDIDDQMYELNQRGREEYLQLQDQIREGLVAEQQAIIDNDQKIADAIDEANSDLISALQSSIDKMRQDRENEKTEEELADKERRLAYLQQDTSGANDIEIAQLQKEIAEGREAYTDNLVDQAINNLQEQNEEAAEQRNRQIQLAEAQLQFSQENGLFNTRLEMILKEGLVTGKLEEGSDLYRLLAKIQEVAGMTEEEKKKWKQETNTTVGAATVYQQTLNNGGSVKPANVSWNSGSGASVETNNKDFIMNTDWSSKMEEIALTQGIDSPAYKAAAAMRETKISMGYDGPGTEISTSAIQNAHAQGKYATGTYYTEEWFKKNGVTMATGGYTGEWGKSGRVALVHEKELILNADDTSNMLDIVKLTREIATSHLYSGMMNLRNLKLADVGASARSLGSSSSEGGDNYFDIDIHVDEISSDYDVNSMIDVVKDRIYQDSMYRNVNAINLLR